MWVAKFKLKDNHDIYTPLCKEYQIIFYAYPYTHFVKKKNINVLIGGTLSGSKENKGKFLKTLKEHKKIKTIEKHHDFILVHAQHSLSRETKSELKIFYNPEFIHIKPVEMRQDGWEYWEVACLDRELSLIL